MCLGNIKQTRKKMYVCSITLKSHIKWMNEKQKTKIIACNRMIKLNQKNDKLRNARKAVVKILWEREQERKKDFEIINLMFAELKSKS